MGNIIELTNLNLYKNKNLTIGLLGGSFDPPHNGHLHIASQALEKLAVDEVWLAIGKQNPTKSPHKYSYNERVNMTSALIKNDSNLKALSIENELDIIYTIDLLNYLNVALPNIKFYFIIGADLAASIHTWDGIDRILQLANLVIFSRAGYTSQVADSEIIKKYSKSGKVTFIPISEINISSTAIRNSEFN